MFALPRLLPRVLSVLRFQRVPHGKQYKGRGRGNLSENDATFLLCCDRPALSQFKRQASGLLHAEVHAERDYPAKGHLPLCSTTQPKRRIAIDLHVHHADHAIDVQIVGRSQ